MNAGLVLLAEQADVAHTTSEVRLLAAVLLSIGAIILLITRLRLHPFLALLLGSGTLAAVASVPFDKLLGSFVTGFGSTIAGVGLLIGLGAMLGRLLADSGGRTSWPTPCSPGPAHACCRGQWRRSPPCWACPCSSKWVWCC